MNKQDLLNALSTKFYKVPEPELVKEEFGVKEYKMYPLVKDAGNNIIYNQYVSFYVENEGLPTEAAYWGGSEPRPTVHPSFGDNVMALIRARTIDGSFQFSYIQAIDSVLKKAYVVFIAPDYVEGKAVISDDGSGNLSIRRLDLK